MKIFPVTQSVGFPYGSAGKESASNAGTWVRLLGWDDPLEKGKATHSSILAWSSPWGHKEVDTTEQLSLHFTFVCKLYVEV